MSLFELLITQTDPSERPIILDFLNEKAQVSNKKKGQRLHTQGLPCNHLHYVTKGLARAFYLKDGKDISCYFASEGMFVTAINSFLKEEVSQYEVELLEDTELLSISFEDLKTALETTRSLERFFRELLSDAYCDLVERVNLLQFYSAKEKYENFMKNFPDLFNRLPLGHIASYLGMTQETLSRVRNES